MPGGDATHCAVTTAPGTGSSTGETVLVPWDRPLGETLEDAGGVPFGCRAGLCGSCLARVQGPVAPPDADERLRLAVFAGGDPELRLACRVRPRGAIRLASPEADPLPPEVPRLPPGARSLLPGDFVRTVESCWDDGAAWLDALPEHLEHCAAALGLVLEEPYPGLSYHYVTRARTRGGIPVVLKTGHPDPEAATERRFLELLAGPHSVQLLDAAPSLGAWVLERIEPGTPLSASQREDDSRATRRALPLLRDLQGPDPGDGSFPTLAQWLEVLPEVAAEPGVPAEVRDLLCRTRELAEALAGEAGPPRLLHGDLHHGNMLLDARRGWVAIDPKGVLAPAEFQPARFLNNPELGGRPRETLRTWTLARLTDLSEGLGSPLPRLAGYALVDAVLGTCWTYQGRARDWVTPPMVAVLEEILERP